MSIDPAYPDARAVHAYAGAGQRKTLEDLDLWAHRRVISEHQVSDDPLSVRPSMIRTTETVGGATGTFTVDVLRGCQSIISLRWTYRLHGDGHESWEAYGARRDDDGGMVSGTLHFNEEGLISNSLTGDEVFDRAFDWLFRQNAVPVPGWLLVFKKAKTKYKTLTLSPPCVFCDWGWCNC